MEKYKNMTLKSMKSIVYIAAIILFCAYGCEVADKETMVSSSFESGSIGAVTKTGNTEWEFSLADDNDNHELPDRWRSWWYVRMDNVDTREPLVIHLKNRGWPYYYVPVYSYDQETWYRFDENEVTQPAEYELKMEKQFTQSTVWIARFYPYTYSDLTDYLDTLPDNSYVTVETPATTQQDNPMYFVTLTDPASTDEDKQRIWMHARSHPAETGPSFLLEGLIDYLVSGTPEAQQILSKFIFTLVPMHNIDGVIAGNYRSTPKSENLEVMWYFDSEDPRELTENAPVEVTALHDMILELNDEGPEFTVALNLHASNSEPDIRPFFYPHFGTEDQGYTETEASLWKKQLRFIDALGIHYGEDMLEPAPDEGGGSFASKSYPESWFWHMFQDEVMAMTVETTYGRAGYGPDWITPDDLRGLGKALAPALRDYADSSITFEEHAFRARQNTIRSGLTYPALYPPATKDEMKE